MSTPHIIGALDTIVSTLEAISIAGGYNHDIETVTLVNNDEPSEAQRPHIQVIVDSSPHTFTHNAGRVMQVEHTLMIVARADVDTDDADTRLEVASQLEDDIIAALGADLVLDQNVTLSFPTEGSYDVSRNNEGSSTSPYATARLEYKLSYQRTRSLTNGNGASLMAHGQIYRNASAGTANVTEAGAYVLATYGTSLTEAALANFTQATPGRLTYTGAAAAYFEITGSVLGVSGAGDSVRSISIARNGTAFGPVGVEVTGSGETGEMLTTIAHTVLNPNDIIDVRISADAPELIGFSSLMLAVKQL